MARPPVTNKQDMYRRLGAGEFGNTLPQWLHTEVDDWRNRSPIGYAKYKLWGVRSQTANDPRTRLNVHRDDVIAYTTGNGLARDGFQLSMMVDQAGNVLFEGEVYVTEAGLLLLGNTPPVAGHGQWRKHMQKPREWPRTAAHMVMRHVLNENSYDDLMELIELYPDHVIEFTAVDSCVGTHPNRNGIIWEVRRY